MQHVPYWRLSAYYFAYFAFLGVFTPYFALYLHALASPLLILAEDDDATHTASNRRALREVSCARELRLIPAIGNDYTASPGLMRAAEDAAGWFVGHFASAATATPRASV